MRQAVIISLLLLLAILSLIALHNAVAPEKYCYSAPIFSEDSKQIPCNEIDEAIELNEGVEGYGKS